ncbi:MAG: hypothetical protein MUE81_23060, partial [Thermoflexibacter sp.]|nr:hypothetical protein [Thermoflexibacter sp.]
NSVEIANDVIKKLLKEGLFNIMTSDDIIRKQPLLIEVFKTIKDADAYLLFVDYSLLTFTGYLFDEIIDNVEEQVRKYNKKCVLLLIDKNIFSKQQSSSLEEENIAKLKKMANNINILQMNLEGDLEEKLSLIINTIQS